MTDALGVRNLRPTIVWYVLAIVPLWVFQTGNDDTEFEPKVPVKDTPRVSLSKQASKNRKLQAPRHPDMAWYLCVLTRAKFAWAIETFEKASFNYLVPWKTSMCLP